MEPSPEQWMSHNQSVPSTSSSSWMMTTPLLFLEQQQRLSSSTSAFSWLPLETNSESSASMVASLLPDLISPSLACGGPLTWVQQQELQLQKMIFRYLHGHVPIPMSLIMLLRTSLLDNLSFYQYLLHFQQYYQHYQLDKPRRGYLRKGEEDLEPGRCKRTDGKKWRCWRNVVDGQKYCERHRHRGRTSSRGLVRATTSTSTTTITTTVARGQQPVLSSTPLSSASTNTFPSSLDLLRFYQRSFLGHPHQGMHGEGPSTRWGHLP